MQLPEGYRLDEVGAGVRMLKRPGGYTLAAFGKGVDPENIRRVAEADERYLEAKELDLVSAQNVREAREKYLLALEAAYREYYGQ